jgi:asparagine synthetase B (glutamine-hydrolysing)
VDQTTVQVIWDGSDCEWNENPGGWTLRQGIYTLGGLVSGVMRVEIECRRQDMTLTIRVSSVAGIPVYYYQSPSGDLVLGSRVLILREAGVPIEADATVLPEFLAYRCLLAPATLFRNIKRVPQGGVLTCVFGAGRPDVRLVSLVDRIKLGGQSEGDLAHHAEVLNGHVDKTIKPLAAIPNHVAMLLSGGIDSSILCRHAERSLGLRDTVSTGYPFEDAAKDVERQYAFTAAKAMGFNHRVYESTTPRYLAGLVESIGLVEAPVSHLQSACMHLLVQEGIDASRNVVLQGLGAGGCVGNFRNFLFIRGQPWARLLATDSFFQLLKLVPSLTGRGRTLLGKLRDMRNRLPLDNPGNPIWKWHQYGDADWICSHFKVSLLDIAARHINRVNGLQAGSLCDTWALYSLLGDEEATLAIWSAIAEGSGKTFYFPFYDESFLQYAMTIPWSIKLGATENVIRKSMAKEVGVPDFILNRRKAGFGIRRDDWALEGGVFDPLARLASDIVGEKEVRALRCREPRKAMLFWNLLNYALWKRICVDGESQQDIIQGLMI